MNFEKYQGIFPAFYACYADNGSISPERVRTLTRYLINKGVSGLYICGSSGECLYLSVEERMQVLEQIMAVAKGVVTVIAHVACNSTADSCKLAAHAETQGVDAIAAIPPIYFHLAEYAIAGYWNDISAAAPHTDFFIYNIPQLAGVSLTPSLVQVMKQNPRVVGVKNSSMPVQDIQMWRDAGLVVFNGPDEQLFGGLSTGAVGGIGGTYCVMPELFLQVYRFYRENKNADGQMLENDISRIIYKMCEGKGSLYAMLKAVLAKQGVNCGSVRKPLPALVPEDSGIVNEAVSMIEAAKERYL